MPRSSDGHELHLNLKPNQSQEHAINITENDILEWDWDIEHQDRLLEKEADARSQNITQTPFDVDRRVLKDVVREKTGCEVGRIKFLSSGTFHKAYLVTLADRTSLVARVARRFMPRLKTESEVATMKYLRQHTSVPVPIVYHYDANPYNRLGGEYILMSKAPGIPLSKVYHSLPHAELLKLLENLAKIIIPLFSHRFNKLGSLYAGPSASTAATPRANTNFNSFGTPIAFPFIATPAPATATLQNPLTPKASPLPHNQQRPPSNTLFAKSTGLANTATEFHVGPIISWPFFGSNRGDLSHPSEIDRGPWSSTSEYLVSCAQREIDGVARENEGKSAPHKLHLDPAEIRASRHHHLTAVPGDESDESDEWDLEESEEEWEGPGDVMYRDYRRMQRSTFLVAHMSARLDSVTDEMQRWINIMHKLEERLAPPAENGDVGSSAEEFGLDCHDLSLENVFVDEQDHSKITCIIDWESTTVRPLWACAHLPAFLQASPFIADIFRSIVQKLGDVPEDSTDGVSKDKPQSLASLAKSWLYYESAGAHLRAAHRCAEWDGWEEELVDSILGSKELEHLWFDDSGSFAPGYTGGIATAPSGHAYGSGFGFGGDDSFLDGSVNNGVSSPEVSEPSSESDIGIPGLGYGLNPVIRKKPVIPLPFDQEREKVQTLQKHGDFCGGRGGELGRRLEAWLHVTGGEDLVAGKRWENVDDLEYEAEVE